MGTEFRILGPVEVIRDGRPCALSGKPLTLLAALLVRANTAVSVSELARVLWADGPEPADAKRTVQTYVLRIRRALGGAEIVTTTSTGYRVDATADTLDLLRFRELSERGVAAADTGDRAGATTLLAAALAVWRGSALDGVVSDVLRAEDVPPLVEERLAVCERWAELRLELGPPPVAELQRLTREHPLREKFWEQLMLALHRSGRQADALAAYRQVHALLAEELGVDPGPSLQQRHEAVLNADPSLDLTPQPNSAVPRQLSAAIDNFTGRAEELADLSAAAARRDDAAAVILSIEGTGGVGKTSLALRFAHDVIGDYPDGQVQLNLRGYGPGQPVEPSAALEYLLQSVGVPGEQIPSSTEARAALWRTHTAGRRVLVVLDNARNSEQIRPLVPGSGCLVVTSRARLGALVARDGAVRILLSRLSEPDALALLATTIGDERVRAEPRTARQFVQRCARLPLAIRILAEHANQQPTRPLTDFLDELGDADALGAFDLDDGDDTSLRAVFARSYRALDPDTAAAFRMLGLHPGRTITASCAAALTGLSVEETSRRLDRLVRAHLLELPAAGRYELHDLLRVFAAEQAATADSSSVRLDAQRRVIEWYLHAARRTSELIRPGWVEQDEPSGLDLPSITGRRDATNWCAEEHANLLLTIDRAGELQLHWHVCQLVLALRPYFNLVPRSDGWMSTHRTALQSARILGDRRVEGRLLNGLGLAHARFGDPDAAVRYCRTALEYARELGLIDDEFAALNNLSMAFSRTGDHQQELAHAEQAVLTADRSGQLRLRVLARNNLASCYLAGGRADDAASLAQETLELVDRHTQLHEHAHALLNLAGAQAALASYDQCLSTYATALEVARDAGAQLAEAEILEKSGDVHAALGDVRQARQNYGGAARLLDGLGHRDAGRVRARLAGLPSDNPASVIGLVR